MFQNLVKFTLDVVTVAKTTEFLLTGCIPDVESEWAAVGVENKRVDLDTQSCNVFLFELTRQVTFHKGGLILLTFWISQEGSYLANTTVANKHQLESGHLLVSHLSIFSLAHTLKIQL